METVKPPDTYPEHQLRAACLMAYELHAKGNRGRFVYCLPPED